ncbi:conserved exported hypothetical protein [Tenacibaculum sp. 190524A05c]|uniref:hypothetical protein n=1 Tax=Tenacibaculum platacis TaxID=3137852 RepID=UPI0031FADD49
MLRLRILFGMIAFISSQIANTQETLSSFKNDLKTTSTNVSVKDAIPVVNHLNNNVALFITDPKNIYGYLLNDNLAVKNKLAFTNKQRTFKTLIGNSIYNNNYQVFLANKKRNKFLFANFSFEKQESQTKQFSLNTPDEKFIQSLSLQNRFYLISANKKTEELFVYSFDEKGISKRHKVTLPDFNFLGKTEKVVTPVALLFSQKNDLKKIDTDVPNPVETSGDLNKMYIRENSIVFSFDTNKNLTQVLTIDLKTFSSAAKSFKKPLEEVKSKEKKSNSFIIDNKIFLATTNSEKLVLQILDYNTGDLIKEYLIEKDQPISFKNTPIIQRGGLYVPTRRMEKTKKYLRKINKDNFGLSARKVDGKYHLVMGGYIPVGTRGVGAGFGNFSVFFNVSQSSFNSSINSVSTIIESLFDEEMNHVEGKIKDDAFDKMKPFHSKPRKGETLFKFKDFFVYVTYYSGSKLFRLEEFKD